MSEIKVNSIKGVGASAAAITVNNSDGTCTANITNNLSNRNKVINGSMIVDQRNSGSASTAISNNYCLDRFRITSSGTDQLAATIQQIQSETDAPSGTGLSRHLKWTTTTPETSIDNDEVIRFQYHIEGGDLQDFCYGTSSAKTVTVSFYVKTSVTGVYAFAIYRDESTDRIINRTYTVSNTDWNRYTFTIAGDTASKISDGNASRWRMMFILAAGSDYTSNSHATWGNYSGSYFAGGHVQNGVCTTNSATWQLTGVQLEVDHTGSGVATDFEHRSFDQELDLCMRYCQVYVNPKLRGVLASATQFQRMGFPLMKKMRTAPSAVWSGTQDVYAGSGTASITGQSAVYTHTDNYEIDATTSGSLSVGAGSAVCAYSGGNEATLTLSAEL